MTKKSHPLYRTWRSLLDRCTSPRNAAWARYGGRGIGVCARWLSGGLAVFASDMGPKPTPHHSIDRRENGGGYWCGRSECPECGPPGREPNCRWATRSEQMRNTRANVRVEGAAIVEWSERTGLSEHLIGQRLLRGWSEADAVTRPRQRHDGVRAKAHGPFPPRSCVWCGAEYVSSQPHRVACGEGCRVRSKKARGRARKKGSGEKTCGHAPTK